MGEMVIWPETAPPHKVLTENRPAKKSVTDVMERATSNQHVRQPTRASRQKAKERDPARDGQKEEKDKVAGNKEEAKEKDREKAKVGAKEAKAKEVFTNSTCGVEAMDRRTMTGAVDPSIGPI